MHSWPHVLLVIVGLFGAQVETSKDPGPKSSPEQRLEFARQAAAAYRFRLAGRDRSEVKLHPEPLLRWTNHVIQEDDGLLFIWTEGDRGRPIAGAQFFVQGPIWHHEFQSLSVDGFDTRFEGEGGAGWAWRPKGPGLDFVGDAQSERPAAAANQRMRQMKAIAERFTAAVDPDGKFESPEQLRLLTSPVYRYVATAQGILDGAVFVFAQGTNPEVLLLIEAVGTDAATAWRYGFARMSCFNLRVMRGDQIVWIRDRAPVPTPDQSSPYFFRLRAQADRSSELSVPVRSAKP